MRWRWRQWDNKAVCVWKVQKDKPFSKKIYSQEDHKTMYSTRKTVFVNNQVSVYRLLLPWKVENTSERLLHSKLNPIITGWMESEKQWKIYLVYSVL